MAQRKKRVKSKRDHKKRKNNLYQQIGVVFTYMKIIVYKNGLFYLISEYVLNHIYGIAHILLVLA